MTDVLLREIDEEVRKDRLEQLWKRHGRKAVALAVALVLVAGASTLWQGRKASQEVTATTALAGLIQSSTPKNAAETQKKMIAFAAEDGPAGPRLLARLYAASWVGDAAQREQALAQLGALTKGAAAAPAPYRDLSTLLSVQQRLDTGDVAQLREELTPLMAEQNPWHFSARELSALLDMRAGDMKSAGATLEALVKEADAPAGLKDRAGKLLATLEK